MDMEKIITLIDEEENEREFEIIATLEVDNTEYAILLPQDEETDEGIVFKITEEGGQEILECVEDDKEFNKVAKAYEELMKEE